MGGSPLESIPIEIPPGGRKEITVGQSFQHPADIAYITFLSDSGFLAGYTRYSSAVNRSSLPATSGVTEGWFPKMEQDGYTGLAFVNITDEDANVKLSAYADSGDKVAEENISVPPGNKVIGMMDQVFHGDISRARYFCFSSDKKVAAFSASESSDGQKLDGLPTLGWYLK